MARRITNFVEKELDRDDLNKGIIPVKDVFGKLMMLVIDSSDKMWMLENAMSKAGIAGGNVAKLAKVRCKYMNMLTKELSGATMFSPDKPRSRKVDKMRSRRV